MDQGRFQRRAAPRWCQDILQCGSAIALLLACGTAGAADGDLDPTFGNNGFMLTGVTAANFQLPAKPRVQPDGKIVICSQLTGGTSGADFFVARFDADGTLDTTFDFDGKVTIDFNGNDDGCNAIALQADGKIIAAGVSADTSNNGDFAVARLNSDGTLDTTFGGGTGKTTIAFDLGGTDFDMAGAIALQTDGKIVVAGWAQNADGNDDFAVVRLLPDGTRDTTFNSTGRVTIGFDLPASTSKTDEADAVAIDGAGRIVVSGVADNGPAGFDFAVARLQPNGQLDQNFDADGRATVGFDLGSSNGDLAYDMLLQRDGKIVLAGVVDTGSGVTANDMGITRLLADGSLDTSFGVAGKTTVPFDLVANGNDAATGIVEESNGRLIVVGAAQYDTTPNSRAAAARLDHDGFLDLSFGAFGKETYDFGPGTSLFTGVALQGTQAVASGLALTGGGTDNLVARMQIDLLFANGFE